MMEVINNKVIWGAVSAEGLAEKYGSPLYFYLADTIRRTVQQFKDAFTYPNTVIYYGCGANNNIALLRLLRKEGVQIVAISPGEIFAALKAGFSPFQILYAGVNISDAEMNFAMDKNVPLSIGEISRLTSLGEKYKGSDVVLRLNVGKAIRLPNGFMSNGPASKIGIPSSQLDEVIRVCEEYKLRVTGLHVHVGHSLPSNEVVLDMLNSLLEVSDRFEHLSMINIGGGLQLEEDSNGIDITKLGEMVSKRVLQFSSKQNTNIVLAIEPGYALLSGAGFFLTKVNAVKKNEKFLIAGVDAGFNNLPPALHGEKWEIINGSNPEGELSSYIIAGNLSEANDIFTTNNGDVADCQVAQIRKNDVLIFKNAGAYSFSLASRYGVKPLPAEVLLDNERDSLIRKRETYEELFANHLF